MYDDLSDQRYCWKTQGEGGAGSIENSSDHYRILKEKMEQVDIGKSVSAF